MFFEILMKFVEKCRDNLFKFLIILMEILFYFYVNFWKNLRGIVGKYALIGINTLIPEKSIDTFPITTPHSHDDAHLKSIGKMQANLTQ